jgi:hypothetical protein
MDYTVGSSGVPGVQPGYYLVDDVSGNLTQTTFSSLITFSRASNATRFSPTGQLEYAPHNLLLQSQTFDNASWTKSNSSITANAATAPDGTITADKEIPANGVAGTYIAQGFSATSGTTYTYTVYAKASEFSELRLLGESGAFGSNTTGVYNLSTGVASVAAGSPTVSMTSVGNGWWRCVWTATATATTTGAVQQRINTTGDGTSGLFIWGAQLSVGPNALDYTPTTTAVVYGPRFDYDPSTLVAQGLLIEEQRTNSIRNNTMVGAVAGTPGTAPTNWFVTTGAGITRELVGVGVENGVTYIDYRFSGTGTVNSDTAIEVSAPALSGQVWTSSTYCKIAAGSLSNVTVTMILAENNSGGGFLAASTQNITPTSSALSTQRFALTRTFNNASTAFAAATLRVSSAGAIDITLRIGLPQLEQGAFATSVIPTTTAATTRSADIASIGTLSPWYNATEGTLYAEASPQVSNVSGCTLVELSTDVQNRIGMFKLTSTGNASLAVLVSNVTQASTNSGAWTATGKMTGAYATNDFASSLNGSAAATDATGTVPTVTTLTLGRRTDNANVLNGHLRRITYTPRRLTNAELQSLTS